MSLLIVAAPIKRPYIWDLSPSASAIQYCLAEGLHVYLLEWMPASRTGGNNGLDEYARAIADCIARISAAVPTRKPFLIGHSLGGTLAAIFATLAPEKLGGSGKSLLPRSIEGRWRADWSCEPLGPDACDCEFSRRCEPSSLSQTLCGRHSGKERAYYSIPR